MPLTLQKEINVIIGKDYPKPIISHEKDLLNRNKNWISQAYKIFNAGKQGKKRKKYK